MGEYLISLISLIEVEKIRACVAHFETANGNKSWFEKLEV